MIVFTVRKTEEARKLEIDKLFTKGLSLSFSLPFAKLTNA